MARPRAPLEPNDPRLATASAGPLFAYSAPDAPETSKAAARRMNAGGTVAKHVGLILAALTDHDGLTGRELGVATELGQVAVMRRMKSIEVSGQVSRGDARDGQVTWWKAEAAA